MRKTINSRLWKALNGLIGPRRGRTLPIIYDPYTERYGRRIGPSPMEDHVINQLKEKANGTEV